MIQATCILKFRNKNKRIYGYRLQDLNQQTQDVTPEDLKRAIASGQINVVNLALTKDGRLIDKTPEKQLEDKGIMPNKLVHPKPSKKELLKEELEEILREMANKLSKAVVEYELAHDREPFVEFELDDVTDDYILGSIYDLTYNEDYDMYGLTFGISKPNKAGTEAFVIFQQNCMGDPVFEYSANLKLPLKSKENLEEIKNLFNKTYKSIKTWIDKGYPSKIDIFET